MKGFAATLLLIAIGSAATTSLAQDEVGPAERIEPGMSTADVLDILGPPDAAQPAILGAGRPSTSIWEYELDSNTAAPGEPERLRIVFEDGEVREISEPARDAKPE